MSTAISRGDYVIEKRRVIFCWHYCGRAFTLLSHCGCCEFCCIWIISMETSGFMITSENTVCKHSLHICVHVRPSILCVPCHGKGDAVWLIKSLCQDPPFIINCFFNIHLFCLLSILSWLKTGARGEAYHHFLSLSTHLFFFLLWL